MYAGCWDSAPLGSSAPDPIQEVFWGRETSAGFGAEPLRGLGWSLSGVWSGAPIAAAAPPLPSGYATDYIPLNRDLSDVIEKLKWARSNEDKVCLVM